MGLAERALSITARQHTTMTTEDFKSMCGPCQIAEDAIEHVAAVEDGDQKVWWPWRARKPISLRRAHDRAEPATTSLALHTTCEVVDVVNSNTAEQRQA